MIHGACGPCSHGRRWLMIDPSSFHPNSHSHSHSHLGMISKQYWNLEAIPYNLILAAHFNFPPTSLQTCRLAVQLAYRWIFNLLSIYIWSIETNLLRNPTYQYLIKLFNLINLLWSKNKSNPSLVWPGRLADYIDLNEITLLFHFCLPMPNCCGNIL